MSSGSILSLAGETSACRARHFGLVRLVEFRIFSDILRTDVRHIEKTTRFGKIRRRLQRRHRRGGVNRVDKHEIGMRFRCRVGQQQLQIAIVAHAPGFSGTDGIHLCHPAPTLLFRYCWRQFDACRCADQRGFGVQRAGIDGQRVVAGGNIVRQRQLQRAVICVRARQIRGQIAAYSVPSSNVSFSATSFPFARIGVAASLPMNFTTVGSTSVSAMRCWVAA